MKLVNNPVIATCAFAAMASIGVAAQQPARPQQPNSPRGTSGSAALSSDDSRFLHEAAIGGMTEVQLGKLAADKASSNDVKQFGQRMVDDHGKANDQLKSLASEKGIDLPTELDAKHKATVDRLSKLSGEAFDKAYVSDMVQDHNKDVATFRKEATSANDPAVKAFAAKTLPTLQEHDRLIKDIASKTGSGSR